MSNIGFINGDILKEKLQSHKNFFVNAYGGFSNMPEKDKSRADEIDNCIAEIFNSSTIDAVPVVRCKDCKWIEKGKDYKAYCNHWKSGLYADVKDDDFCSYGERRNNE